MSKLPFIMLVMGCMAVLAILFNFISIPQNENFFVTKSSSPGRSTRAWSDYYDSSYQEEEALDITEFQRHQIDKNNDNDDDDNDNAQSSRAVRLDHDHQSADLQTFASSMVRDKRQRENQPKISTTAEMEYDDDDNEKEELEREEVELNMERNIKSDIMMLDRKKVEELVTKKKEDDKKKKKDDDTKKKSTSTKKKKEKVYYNALDPNNRHEKIGKKKYPSLSKLATDNSTGIIGDVSFLLDFAILGHAKTATSYLTEWLHGHDQIHIWDYEVCDLYDHKPAKLVSKLYNDFHLPNVNKKDGTIRTNYYKRGFKCPGHFSRPSLRYFHDVFPNTVLIIGVRHPVKWFESYYNFRFRHMRWDNVTELPEPKDLMSPIVEECPPQAQGVCTVYAKFHQNLAKFGKTNWRSTEEQKLLNLDRRIQSMRTIHNPIFLYDMSQFYDTNVTRKEQLKRDLQHYLNLTKPLTDKEHHISTREKVKAINICDPQFVDVREQLVAIGKRASIWIRKYFITLPEIYTSSTYYFEQILQTWKYDPCIVNVTAML